MPSWTAASAPTRCDAQDESASARPHHGHVMKSSPVTEQMSGCGGVYKDQECFATEICLPDGVKRFAWD